MYETLTSVLSLSGGLRSFIVEELPLCTCSTDRFSYRNLVLDLGFPRLLHVASGLVANDIHIYNLKSFQRCKCSSHSKPQWLPCSIKLSELWFGCVGKPCLCTCIETSIKRCNLISQIL